MLVGCGAKINNQKIMNSKKVLLVIASEGFQIIEYKTPKEILEKAGVQVVTVSDRAGEVVAASGEMVKVDLMIGDPLLTSPYKGEENTSGYGGLFFVGGPGALERLDNEASYQLLKTWQETGKPYGAICISPRILAHAGVLQGKKATGWNGDGELAGILSSGGAEFVDQSVVVDGNVITGNGPGAASEFGEAIVALIAQIK